MEQNRNRKILIIAIVLMAITIIGLSIALMQAKNKNSGDGKNSAEIDASIVCTHMMLEVADLGLGSTWVGSFDEEIVKKILPQTADYEVLALLPVGHPADGAEG